MNRVALMLGALAAGLLAFAWRRGDGSHRTGVEQGWRLLLRTLPLLIVAFVIIGYVDVLAPQRLVQGWIGPGSGWPGIVWAEAAGMALPGGPYVVFPLVATLYHAGAAIGPAVAMITAWAMNALLTISFELPFLGWRFTAVRWGLGLFFPVLAGAAAQALFG